jgi:hypothetical protein
LCLSFLKFVIEVSGSLAVTADSSVAGESSEQMSVKMTETVGLVCRVLMNVSHENGMEYGFFHLSPNILNFIEIIHFQSLFLFIFLKKPPL